MAHAAHTVSLDDLKGGPIDSGPGVFSPGTLLFSNFTSIFIGECFGHSFNHISGIPPQKLNPQFSNNPGAQPLFVPGEINTSVGLASVGSNLFDLLSPSLTKPNQTKPKAE